MAKRNPGIQITDFGFRAFARVHGVLYTRRFPKEATQTEMQNWRASVRTDVLRAEKRRTDAEPEPGTFAEDIKTYLAAVKAMPTYTDRESEIKAWLTALDGTQPRTAITSAAIRTALQQWRLSGKRIVERIRNDEGRIIEMVYRKGPLSESACNHRRTALMHFFSVLNGKSGANPVRDVPKFREPDPQPRGVPPADVQKVIDAMPASKTKARVMVMAATGLPHSTLMRLERNAVDYAAQTVLVPRRRKGRGTKTRVLPLSPAAVAAFKAMETWGAWGAFSPSSLRKCLRLACRKAKVPEMRAYDLRHSFGTAAYAASGDIRAVQALLDHSDAKLTERYTLAAVDARMRAALTAMQPAPVGRKVAAKVTRSKKPAKKRRKAMAF